MASELDKFLNEVNGNTALDIQKENPFAHFDEEQKPAEEKKEEEASEEEEKKEEEKVEEEKEEEEPEEEKPVAYHQDPKLQRYIAKMVRKGLEEMGPRESEAARSAIRTSQNEDEMTAVFAEIIGNDTPEKRAALEKLNRAVVGIREEARAGVRQLEESRNAEAAAEKELSEGIENIEDTFNVDMTSGTPKARKLKGDFLDFIERLAPKDKNGDVKEYPDFEYAFELFKEKNTKPAPSKTKAKELAARGLARSSDATKVPQIQGNSWADVEKFFSRFEDR